MGQLILEPSFLHMPTRRATFHDLAIFHHYPRSSTHDRAERGDPACCHGAARISIMLSDEADALGRTELIKQALVWAERGARLETDGDDNKELVEQVREYLEEVEAHTDALHARHDDEMNTVSGAAFPTTSARSTPHLDSVMTWPSTRFNPRWMA